MERKNGSYIGITGFTGKEEIFSTLSFLPHKLPRLLMVGGSSHLEISPGNTSKTKVATTDP